MSMLIRSITAIPSDLELPIYAITAVLFLSEMFIGLFIFNFSQLYLIRYLVKRWKLKERCGKIHA
jgi:hypothetical protein